jgi:predicted outer membrane repeat protein
MFGITAAFLPPSGAATACNTTVLPYITVGGQADPAFNTPNLVNDPTTIIISNNSSGGSGGGIDAESSEGVTLLCTWVFGNTASSSSGCGGGVYLHNVLLTQISYSTFQNNVSKSACGGGIAAVLDRGSGTFGMFSMSVDDSTFAANKGATNGGGVYLKGVDAYFNHDTFNDNQLTSRVGSGGVAIYADTRANAYLENVLADDTHGLAHGLALLAFGGVSPAGVISSMGHNLSSDNSLSTVVNFNILNGDIANGIQGLTALDFHGGCTPTYNLVAGGQAIGAGDLLGPITDQNFVSRPIGSASDIGAVQH